MNWQKYECFPFCVCVCATKEDAREREREIKVAAGVQWSSSVLSCCLSFILPVSRSASLLTAESAFIHRKWAVWAGFIEFKEVNTYTNNISSSAATSHNTGALCCECVINMQLYMCIEWQAIDHALLGGRERRNVPSLPKNYAFEIMYFSSMGRFWETFAA